MPEATKYVFSDDQGSEARAIESAFVSELRSRSDKTGRAWKYYNGDHDLPLKTQQDGYNDNVIVNHVEALADRLVAFLLGDGITFDAGGDDQPGQQDDQIAELWQANRGAILQESITLSGAIEGHNAIRLMPREGAYPRLVRIKMSHFAAFYDPFDMENVLWYRLQHQAGGTGKRIDYVKGRVDGDEVDHNADGWTQVVYRLDKIMSGSAIDASAQWKRVEDEVVPWEYDWPPIVDWQNLPNPNGYYGKSDVSMAIKLNDALNFILSNMQRIIKHFAAPKTIGIGFSAGDVVVSPVGGLYTVNKDGAEIFNLEMQSDMASSMQLAGLIAESLWQSGGMVDPQTMKDRIGQLTNFGLRVLFSDAIKRTQKKRLLYEEAMEAICQHGLELAGVAPPDAVMTVWPDVLPEDNTVVDALMQELQNGIISKETYRNIRGYDSDKEEDRLAQERATGDVGASILDLISGNRGFNRGA